MDLMSTAQLLGNFGEFFGAIAVVITLGYLVLQIRLSADETARASRESASTSVGGLMLQIALDEPTYRLFRAGVKDPNSLQEDQQFRFNMILYSIFDQWETIHGNWRRGRMPDEDWEKWDAIIANYLMEEGVQRFWSELSQQFTSAFRAYIDGLEPSRNYEF